MAESEANAKEKQYALWGLGRGIDITKPTPWLEKTSFQVRKVEIHKIIETDDGGLLKEYSDEIRCRTDLNCEVKSGVKAANAPLTIGVAAEYTRSSLTTKYVVGTRVKNRTISFRTDFTDLPQSRAKDLEAAKDEIRKRKEGEAKREVSKFEERLCSWLLECLKHRGEQVKCLDKYIRDKCAADPEKELEKIVEDIELFVHHFGVTHYVSAIELGGLEYQELSGKEYHQHAGMSSNASVTSPAHGGVEASTKMSCTKKSGRFKKDRKKVGRINFENEKVTEENEAVIGCEIQPISNLVGNPYLQQALTTSTAKYTTAREKYRGNIYILKYILNFTFITLISSFVDEGPYFITCGDIPTMYITVDKNDKSLVVTFNEEDAEVFSLKALGDDTAQDKFEFSLTSPLHKYRDQQVSKIKALAAQQPTDDNGRTAQLAGTSQQLDASQASSSLTPTKENTAEDKGKTQLPLEYYLETVVSPLLGKDSTTPRMRLNSSSKNIRMLLKKRVNHRIACDTKQWRKGREAYFIQCIHPFRSGFLCVKKKSQCHSKTTNPDDYKVCVKPSVSSRCDDSEIFMLFRLKTATEFIEGSIKRYPT